jgi:hypothetical protein
MTSLPALHRSGDDATRRQFVIAAVGSVLFLGAVGLTFFVGLLTPLLPAATNTVGVTVLLLAGPPFLFVVTGLATWFRSAAQRLHGYRPRGWAPFAGIVLLAVMWVASNEMTEGLLLHYPR